jgi:hypothetical protein
MTISDEALACDSPNIFRPLRGSLLLHSLPGVLFATEGGGATFGGSFTPG